ncbi:MAG: bifunctional UDP-N-acetylglucosamine diphosphorylase/glucosamine-1-phosphate N-acetyltransferase GlmU [Pseudomonadota bacterium]|nr:bifunctional UDP-N-acetylglucosamine diphosphorylase/glucosamine-1-phosphate N-acetyltransferase GlmU [Pseudomonadota bacterium]
MNANHKHKFAAVVLAAGSGTRMKSSFPKVMHRLAGQPMIAHVLTTLNILEPERSVVVIAPSMDMVRDAALETMPDCKLALQDRQQGTGHAVGCAEAALSGYAGTVLVLYGDTPLITESTLSRLLVAMQSADVAVLGMRIADPTGYGRLIVDSSGQLEEIVECKDASPEQKGITLCNSGVMAAKGTHLFSLLKKIQPNNAAGEYYLTDIVEQADAQGLHCHVVEAEAGELAGINSRAQLAEAEKVIQQRLRHKAMTEGATLIDPESVYFSMDTALGRDVVVHPQVVFGPGVTVEDKAEIRSFSHIEGAQVRKGAVIGPFARLRPGSVVGEAAHVGNFVELKKTTLGKGAKANHLSYIGDAEVGEGANIGAGTITCNYDGANKYVTIIGAEAFIGSNTSLVAPVTIGAGAMVGAGSVITDDVEADALAIARPRQVSKPAKAREIKKRKKKA